MHTRCSRAQRGFRAASVWPWAAWCLCPSSAQWWRGWLFCRSRPWDSPSRRASAPSPRLRTPPLSLWFAALNVATVIEKKRQMRHRMRTQLLSTDQAAEQFTVPQRQGVCVRERERETVPISFSNTSIAFAFLSCSATWTGSTQALDLP